MYTKFLNLKTEKKERILNAAIKEFAQKGYKNASTDEIVKTANISKGSLFLYFKNKKDLFLFLYDHVLHIVMDEFFGKIELNEKDILKRLRQVLLVKLTLSQKYPDLFEFVKAANHEEADEVKPELNLRNKEYIADSYSRIFSDLDTSSFREDIDIARAVNVVSWATEGFAAAQERKFKQLPINALHPDEIVSELDLYLELLKKCLYK